MTLRFAPSVLSVPAAACLAAGFLAFLAAAGLTALMPEPASAAPPDVTNVLAVQRPGTKLVDVTYDLYSAGGHTMTVRLYLSDDDGATFPIECVTATGHIGSGITSGTGRQIVWDAGTDYPGYVGDDYRVKVTAIGSLEQATIAYYPLDGNADDYSGNGRHGTFLGSPQEVPGVLGTAMQFNGSPECVELDRSWATPHMSVSLWMKSTTTLPGMLARIRLHGFAMIVNSSNSVLVFDLFAGADDIIRYTLHYDGALLDGSWHHVVMSYGPPHGLQMYVNGDLVAEANSDGSEPLYVGDGGFALARDGDYDGSFYRGGLDEVHIFNRPLVQEEVAFLYTLGGSR